jgi:hypothetical protein
MTSKTASGWGVIWWNLSRIEGGDDQLSMWTRRVGFVNHQNLVGLTKAGVLTAF